MSPSLLLIIPIAGSYQETGRAQGTRNDQLTWSTPIWLPDSLKEEADLSLTEAWIRSQGLLPLCRPCALPECEVHTPMPRKKEGSGRMDGLRDSEEPQAEKTHFMNQHTSC